MPDPSITNHGISARPRVEVLLEAVLAKLDQLLTTPKANLKKSEFARLAKMDPRAVRRKIESGEIPTVRGRIPFSELKKYVS